MAAYSLLRSSAPPEAPPRAATRPPALDALVALQAADGSWELTAELAAIIGRDLAEIEAALAGASGEPPDVRRAWATALALRWLKVHAGGVEDEWRLLAAKARTWLEEVEATPPSGWMWTHAANEFLG